MAAVQTHDSLTGLAGSVRSAQQLLRIRFNDFRVGLRRKLMIVPGKQLNSKRDRDSQQQHRRQLKPIVGMKVHFGQQIAQGNAQKDPRGKCEAIAQYLSLIHI